MQRRDLGFRVWDWQFSRTAALKGLEQAEEPCGLPDARKLDAERLHLEEQVLQ